MKIKTVICDDMLNSIYILKMYIEKIGMTEFDVIETFTDGYELIEFCEDNNVELILLDIDLPFINGIDSAKKIKELLPEVEIIFITAYQGFSLQAFQLYATDYIVKPISIERLEETLKIILKRKLASQNKNNYYEKSVSLIFNHKTYNINKTNTIFIERANRKCLVHFDNQIIETYESLEYFQERLDPNIFIRIHSGFLVNILFVEKICKKEGGVQTVSFKNFEKRALVSRRNVPKLYRLLDNINKC